MVANCLSGEVLALTRVGWHVFGFDLRDQPVEVFREFLNNPRLQGECHTTLRSVEGKLTDLPGGNWYHLIALEDAQTAALLRLSVDVEKVT